MKFIRFTLRKKLMGTLLLTMLIPTITVGFFSYNSSHNSLKSTLLDDASMSIQTADKIVTQLIGAKVTDIDEYSQIFNKTQSIDPESSGMLEQLQIYLRTHAEAQNIFVGTDEGKMIQAKDNKLPAGFDPRVRPWYKQAIDHPSQTVISSVEIDSTKRPVVFISRTLGKGQGVLGLSLDLSKLQEMTSIRVGTKGYIMILDKSRRYATHPTEPLGVEVKADYVDRIFASAEDQFEYQYNGQSKQMIFVTNPLTGWKISGTLLNSEITDAVKPIRNTTLIVIVSSILLIGSIAFLLINSLLKPLKRLQRSAQQISEGDLTLQVATNRSDEIGELSRNFQQMVNNLRSMIVKVHEMTENLSSSSQQLAASTEQTISSIEHVTLAIQEVSTGSERQLGTIRESKEHIDIMSADLNGISSSMQKMTDQAADTIQLSDEGSEAISLSTTTMDSIHTTMEQLSVVIHNLSSHSSDIGSIVNTISDIARQTNLLALNASIEAARAGEHGRGFNVVATEVRKLAELSGKSAQQINDLIQGIQHTVLTALNTMSTAQERVGEGISAVDLSGRAFSRIRRSVNQSAEQINAVSTAAGELFQKAKTVVHAMNDIARISGESAANTETVSAAAQEQLASMEEIGHSSSDLTRLAEQLQELVEQFKIYEDSVSNKA
ncbi:MAG: HAMP domain-containing protein [Paenibacillus sp.]|nr:HAMP domain-containing protein [Paenibacillus sp.]